MNTLSLPSTRHGVRFVLYPGHSALHIVDQLTHLELVDARVPAGEEAPALPDSRAWLAACVEQPGFRLVTMSEDGLLVGFAAGSAHEGRIVIDQVVLAAGARTRNPDIAGELVDAFVESADLPWADVVIRSHDHVLAHLLSDGWRPARRDTEGPDAQAAGGQTPVEDEDTLVLSAAVGR